LSIWTLIKGKGKKGRKTKTEKEKFISKSKMVSVFMKTNSFVLALY
jgi:hypothetical protein